MKLYVAIIDWIHYDERQEAEWFFFTGESYVHYEIVKKAKEHLTENVDVRYEDIKINNVWVNHVDEVDGYKVTLTKEK